MAALIYGVFVAAGSRPVFVAFLVDRFEVVTAVEMDNSDLAAATDLRYRSLPWLGPKLVGVQLPSNVNERNNLLFSAIAGKDAQLMPKYYRPYETMIDGIKRKSESLEVLIAARPEKKQELEAAVRESGRAQESVRWLPVHNRFGFWTALIDAKTGYPVNYLRIDPYQF